MSVVDLGMVLTCSVFILASAYLFKKKKLDRFEGIILLLLEAGYMWYLISTIN
jgi:Ca2+/Na+ antiporter